MELFTLELLHKITGIGSASGLVYKDNSLFIISDNSSFLYKFCLQEKELTKIPLLANAQENIPKKDKFDFESLTLKGNELHLLEVNTIFPLFQAIDRFELLQLRLGLF